MRYALVLPNLSTFRARGKLPERWALAAELGCGAAELPADLVKSPNEEVRTGQPIGDVLTETNVEKLYHPPLPEGRFVLHTDPGIPRRDRKGSVIIPQLRWGNLGWCRRYALSVGWMAEAVGGRVEAVEVHPGKEAGSQEELARGFIEFSDALAETTGRHIPVLVENKHRHRMDRTEDMAALMDLLPGNGFGVVVDISNLWKTYRTRTPRALGDLPWERVRGIHLHLRHRAPQADDPVEWEAVFGALADNGMDMLLNPEVFHLRELKNAIAFIRDGLGQG